MQTFLTWAQLITCVILILSVMFQDSKNAPQMYGGNNNQNYFKPRGKEAILNNLTKMSGIALFSISIISLIIK